MINSCFTALCTISFDAAAEMEKFLRYVTSPSGYDTSTGDVIHQPMATMSGIHIYIYIYIYIASMKTMTITNAHTFTVAWWQVAARSGRWWVQ